MRTNQFGWEEGNELVIFNFELDKNIAAYIKSIDKNRLVVEGTHSQVIFNEALADTNIDILSMHDYRPIKQIINTYLVCVQKPKV
ncbi:MAG: hypothetical protein ABSA44_10495 [Bacteroidota bacterium]|jgi:hypothetical protein